MMEWHLLHVQHQGSLGFLIDNLRWTLSLKLCGTILLSKDDKEMIAQIVIIRLVKEIK
jgi:hypothetical protein